MSKAKLQSIIDTLAVFTNYLDNTKEQQRNEDISAFLIAIKNQLEEIKECQQ